MKTKLIIIGVLICWLVNQTYAQIVVTNPDLTPYVTKEQALAKVKALFNESEANYYLIQDNEKTGITNWRIFVDVEPLKGWEHDAYIVSVPKNSLVPLTSMQKSLVRVPPSETLEPMEVNVKYLKMGAKLNIQAGATNSNNDVAARTYVVILNGGINKNSNKIRYWNDCAFLYQALKRSYGVPQENFRILMSDGTDPEEDMMQADNQTYLSSPLDLDYDGVNDIEYSATKENVYTVLSNLATSLNRDDHLLLFVIDHGGSMDEITQSFICLWNNEVLYDYELADYLTPLLERNVSVNVVLGQCYSGGFIDNLAPIGCIVSAACKGSEPSYSRSDLQHDEFVYHWTCAINGLTPKGTKVDADFNKDGRVTMDEAFKFAKENDKMKESPVFDCGPDDYGRYLAFSYLPKSDDLYIKDNYLDVGDEPNYTTDIFWNSPSIWVRNQNDSIQEHQNPSYNNVNYSAFMYTYVHNKGEKRYYEGKWLHRYWANASSGLRPKTWRGREIQNGYQSGCSVESMAIKYRVGSGQLPKPVLPKDSILIVQPWTLPSSLQDEEYGNHHYCLYAKILDGPTDEPMDQGSRMLPQLSNKEAQKNLIIVRIEDDPGPLNIFVRNVVSSTSPYSLEIFTRNLSDTQIFSIANVEMEMSQSIYNAWVRGGKKSVDIMQVSDTQNGSTAQSKKVRLLSPNSKLQALKMNPDEFDIITMSFNITEFPPAETSYYLDLIQRDENGTIIGGETFLVIVPASSHREVPIRRETTEEGDIKISVDSENFKSISWFDENGEKLGSTKQLIISPSPIERKLTVTGYNQNGENAKTAILIEPQIGFQFVSQEGTSLKVQFVDKLPQGTSLGIHGIEAGSNLLIDLPEDEREIQVDTSTLTRGMYTLSLIVDSVVIDNWKILINN